MFNISDIDNPSSLIEGTELTDVDDELLPFEELELLELDVLLTNIELLSVASSVLVANTDKLIENVRVIANNITNIFNSFFIITS